MKPGKRSSLLNAITMPLSILLYWQALGWLAFGVLEPGISQSLRSPVDSRLILTVGIVMAIATTSLGTFFLYYHVTTLQRDIFPQHKTLHKCLNCGHDIADGITTCPYCGSRTLF
ncbi:MAG TPA: zinc ribbon domain-containing protein [Candidatus Bathyarchaeia archaeon]|nr:zinc ribbon domain-containing protein [Candidatus Bathyarchaeia archaeon]